MICIDYICANKFVAFDIHTIKKMGTVPDRFTMWVYFITKKGQKKFTLSLSCSSMLKLTLVNTIIKNHWPLIFECKRHRAYFLLSDFYGTCPPAV